MGTGNSVLTGFSGTQTYYYYESSTIGGIYSIADSNTGPSPLSFGAEDNGKYAFCDASSVLTGPGPNSSNIIFTS